MKARRRRTALAAGLAVAGLVAAAVVLGPGLAGEEPRTPPPRAPAPQRPPTADEPPAPTADRGEGLAVGLTETNAGLLANPQLSPSPRSRRQGWRDRLTALRPRPLPAHGRLGGHAARPRPAREPRSGAVDGCSRGQPPCVPSSGVRDVLRSVAMQQRAGNGCDVLVVIYGVPDWAAAPAWRLRARPTSGRARAPIADGALPAYRALVRAIADAGTAEGVSIRWWSPWNEANGPFFVSPQRGACDRSSPLALARRLHEARARDARRARRAARRPGAWPSASSPACPGRRCAAAASSEFFAGLPDDVVCAAGVFTQHAYAERGDPDAATGPVDQLEAALAEPAVRRRASRSGSPRRASAAPTSAASAPAARRACAADCRAMDAVLRRWDLDPRVEAAFQYTFRDDPSFPVGLADAALHAAVAGLRPVAAWGGQRPAAAPPPELPDACADAAG